MKAACAAIALLLHSHGTAANAARRTRHRRCFPRLPCSTRSGAPSSLRTGLWNMQG